MRGELWLVAHDSIHHSTHNLCTPLWRLGLVPLYLCAERVSEVSQRQPIGFDRLCLVLKKFCRRHTVVIKNERRQSTSPPKSSNVTTTIIVDHSLIIFYVQHFIAMQYSTIKVVFNNRLAGLR